MTKKLLLSAVAICGLSGLLMAQAPAAPAGDAKPAASAPAKKASKKAAKTASKKASKKAAKKEAAPKTEAPK